MEAAEAPREREAHPIGGRWGTGPPIAPPGWGWRAGFRLRDMYFTSPDGDRFRSQVQLNAYLGANAGSPSPAHFRWSFSRNDYQDGTPLPGNAPPPKSHKRKSTEKAAEPAKRQKVADGERRKSQAVDQSPHTPEHNSPSRLRSFSRLDEDVEVLRRTALMYGTRQGDRHPGDGTNVQRRKRTKTGPSTGASDRDPLAKFIAEGAPFGDKSEAEVAALERLVHAKVKDMAALQKLPVDVLRVYFRLVRKEEAPACFRAMELSKLCGHWICRHRRPWCLREQDHIRIMKDTVEKRNHQEVVNAERIQLEKLLILCGSCKREGCCADPSFCSGCSCAFCKGVIATKLCWSYLRCQHCSHVAHLDCALQKRRAGVVKTRDLDVEYLCAACLRKTSLVSFWKSRIRDALDVGNRAMVEHHLSAAGRVVRGTQRASLRHLQAQVQALQHSDFSDQGCSELLRSADSVQLEYEVMDPSVISEMLEANEPLKLDSDEEAEEAGKGLELQKKAESDYSGWLAAEKVAESQRMLVRQLQEQLRIAEDDVQVKAGLAATSQARWRKAEKRFEVLEMLKAMKGVPRETVELQRWICGQELAKMETLRKKFESADVDRFSALLDALRAQHNRVEVARNRLEQLVGLQKLLP